MINNALLIAYFLVRTAHLALSSMRICRKKALALASLELSNLMETVAELLLLTTVQQLMRTGAILSRAKSLLSESAFVCVLTEHSISQQHAAVALDIFHEAQQSK